MTILLQPLILDKLFEFLSVHEVYWCQYVCQTWRESALQNLKKRPAINGCRPILACRAWYIDEDGSRQKEELIIKNPEVYMVDEQDAITTGRYPLSAYAYHWYVGRSPISDLLPKSDFDKTVHDFLTHNAKCIPGFSFLQHNQEFETEDMEGITLNHPAVLIKLGVNNSETELLNCKTQNRTRPLEIADEEELPELFPYPGSAFFSYFEGFHLNRYIPGVKIIITDWSDHWSPRPEMNDPEFPVKSVLYLATSVTDFSAKISEIEKLLGQSEVKPISCGGVLQLLCDWEYGGENDDSLEDNIISTIFFIDHNKSKPKKTSIITIAFAGEGVKSAYVDILFMPNFKERLQEFKRDLDFPTDDDRTIGFIIRRYYRDTIDIYGDSSYPHLVFFSIRTLFPSIKTSTIDIETRSHLPKTSRADMTLLLIRV